MNYILTCNDNTRKHLIDAFTYYNIKGNFTWFNSTEALLTTSIENDTLVRLIKDSPILFVRHLFKVDSEVPYVDLRKAILNISMDSSKSFSIQLRSPQQLRQDVNALRNECVDSLIGQGLTLDVKNPQQIISVFVEGETAYIGLGNAELNLSKWSSGAMHFSRDHAMISRAEFKLLEAFEIFNIDVDGGVAVDLGAAPGGWSYVLSKRNYTVHAIDPAHLDERVKNVPTITHHPVSSQAFLESNPDFSFDLIVNDMKMSYPQSIELVRLFSESMKPDGLGIITIKLSKNYRFEDTIDAIQRVNRYFDIQGGRQLFHNRNEFTLIIKKRVPHENISQ